MNELELIGLELNPGVTGVLAKVLRGHSYQSPVAMTKGNLELDGLVALSTGKALRTFKKRVKGETIMAEGVTELDLKETKATLDKLSLEVNSNTSSAYRLSVMIAQVTELHSQGYTMIDLQPSVTSRQATIRAKKDAAPTQKAQIDLLQEVNARLMSELKALRNA